MNDKTSTARIVTASDVSNKAIGRSAIEWRNDFLINWAGQHAPIGHQETVKIGAHEKPRFEIHERETAKREYRAVLIERRPGKANQEIAAVRIGMFGKLLDKPQRKEVAPAEVNPLEVAPEGESNDHTNALLQG